MHAQAKQISVRVNPRTQTVVEVYEWTGLAENEIRAVIKSNYPKAKIINFSYDPYRANIINTEIVRPTT